MIRVLLVKQAGTGGGSPKWDGRSITVNRPSAGELIRLEDDTLLRVQTVTHVANVLSGGCSAIITCKEA